MLHLKVSQKLMRFSAGVKLAPRAEVRSAQHKQALLQLFECFG